MNLMFSSVANSANRLSAPTPQGEEQACEKSREEERKYFRKQRPLSEAYKAPPAPNRLWRYYATGLSRLLKVAFQLGKFGLPVYVDRAVVFQISWRKFRSRKMKSKINQTASQSHFTTNRRRNYSDFALSSRPHPTNISMMTQIFVLSFKTSILNTKLEKSNPGDPPSRGADPYPAKNALRKCLIPRYLILHKWQHSLRHPNHVSMSQNNTIGQIKRQFSDHI